MKRYVAGGFCLVVAAELTLFVVHDRSLVLSAAAIGAAIVVIGARWYLDRDARTSAADAVDGPSVGLHRWLTRTQTLIGQSESTRSDWDRHLRPMLARQFEMATGARKAKSVSAFQATGRVLFGDELWSWVDPDNVSRTGRDEPGPGRDALNEILQRLERV